MRVLLTGAGSFTGAFFARALAEGGAEVIAPLRGPLATTDVLRTRRLAKIRTRVELVPAAAMGSTRLRDLAAANGPFDLVCLHAAEVGDFRRPDYDPFAAAASTTAGLGRLLEAARCRAVLVTGSVFEADAGAGDASLGAIGAYGLAKTLAFSAVRWTCEQQGVALSKFTIAHPFGPFEKAGLTSALLAAWAKGEAGLVARPRLVRDFVPVSALAQAYADMARTVSAEGVRHRLTPSGFAEPVVAFVERLARAMRPRLGRPCAYIVDEPATPSAEPLRRVGIDRLAFLDCPAAIEALWDSYATCNQL